MTVEHEGRTYTERGFRVYLDRERPPEERLYGREGTLTVSESSIAARGAHVWIGVGEDSFQVNVPEARLLVDALATFVAEAEAGELTEGPEPTP